MSKKEKIEAVHGSGNVFRDFGEPNADIEQLKAILAAKVIGILDRRKLSTRKAESLTGVDHSEFVKIRNVNLDRFTVDRLISVLNKLDQQVDVKVKVQSRPQKRIKREATMAGL